ncbi:MAG: ORF6N domain-containing protein [Candidatus Margulisbacteria bacterium]|nr:ORF6N domain-containing protein [Candidatus Margulisiibacteriota bacterium]
MNKLIPSGVVENKICIIRDKKIMLDFDLALLYGVETKYLKRQVKRNKKRFSFDFMFQLTRKEYLRCQNVTSSYGGRRYLPYAFTEQGVAMLSSVLNSERAINVNIEIMRAFVKLRGALSWWPLPATPADLLPAVSLYAGEGITGLLGADHKCQRFLLLDY